MTQFKVYFNDFKRRDNTNLMEITLYKDNGEQIIPNRDHQWSGKALKFGDGDKRLDQELAVTLDGDKIGVPSKQLENLPSGDYGLELWEVNNDSKTIYPSAGFVEFHIHRNADESLESVTPTIDIDKIIDDLHQAGLNVVVDGIEMLAPDATPSVTSEVRDGKNHIKLHVPRGFKGDVGPAPTLKIGTVTKLNPDQTPTANVSGDNGVYTLDMGIPQGSTGATGTVDNDGLTNAPAFQALQTQVNNSAVGTNLLTNSNFSSGLDKWFVNPGTNLDGKAVVTTDSDGDTCVHITGTGNVCGLYCSTVLFNQNQVTTGSVLVKGTGALIYVGLEGGAHSNFGTISAGTYSKVSSTMQAGSGTRSFCVYFNPVNGVLDVYIKFVKLEKNSVATDWSPNPSEILTQSDYTKIKAAIVALGGSLS